MTKFNEDDLRERFDDGEEEFKFMGDKKPWQQNGAFISKPMVEENDKSSSTNPFSFQHANSIDHHYESLNIESLLR